MKQRSEGPKNIYEEMWNKLKGWIEQNKKWSLAPELHLLLRLKIKMQELEELYKTEK